jgi:two-component system, NtrC family, sensor kinase
MSSAEPFRPEMGRWKRLTHSISGKLIALLLALMFVIFATLGYLNIRQHRHDLETASLAAAERTSDVIKRSTSYSMLRNDREGMYHIMDTIAHEPGIVRVRIINGEGRISFSTDPSEVSKYVDKSAESCYVCHAQAQPLVHLNRPDRNRIFQVANPADPRKKTRVLGIINPIENSPSCANAECHAHPASQKILGVLDSQVSMDKADADLRAGARLMIAYTSVGLLLLVALTTIFVWRVVGQPVRLLKTGTERLSEGELGYQIDLATSDELGELAHSFNAMSRDLLDAHNQITAWARTLEERVEQKTSELKRVHEQVLQVEKMASIGRMASVLAHEINNPLSGILTYAKLLHRWVDRLPGDAKKPEMLASLDLISSESRRCGDLVKNLLTFARVSPINLGWTELNAVVQLCVRLIQHKMEMSGVQWHLELDPDLPKTFCDAAQIEQLLLALSMNATEAMSRGGNLWLSTSVADEQHVALKVRDDGCGIPPELMKNIFEPFHTTKQGGSSAGLGLAVSRSIVERHHGRIEVQSEIGRGTTFTITLPIDGQDHQKSAPAGRRKEDAAVPEMTRQS